MSFFPLIIAILFFIAGLAGTVLPVLPGVPLIWAGMFLYGLLTGFARLSWSFYLVQGLITVFVLLLDYLAAVWGVKKYGGSRSAGWGAVLGGIIGLALLGPVGVIAGPFLGAALAELASGKEPAQALRTGFGTVVGFLGGTLLKLGIEIVMIVWFFLAVF
ncbi:MAG: DUF456 family protein [Clostridia bacterium]|nr:DUF456 family protein [Clostridia bacterium]